MVALSQVEDFLAERRIVMFGVSRNAKNYSRLLYIELIKRGYDVLIVHPTAREIDGNVCFRSVKDIKLPAQAALLVLPPEKVDHAITECVEAGINQVWVRSKTMRPSVDPATAKLCHASGISLIDGLCPFMFLSETPFIHRLHGTVLKVVGHYPR